MQALVDSHIFVRGLDVRELFRSAYLNKYQRELSAAFLDQDLLDFKQIGKVPAYVVDLMLQVYGHH